jgi:DNA helicase-2/ATP-dependent DNA helicase PcrA
MDFSTRYAKLNAAQKQAVDTIDGPVMVVAGPGTGKTELLSMRVANILKQTDTLPENILCLTFTESGASAMRSRLSQIIGKDAFKVAIHTFHSFGAEVINQNSQFFYHGAHFRAADELSSYQLLSTIFDELKHDSPLASKMNGEYTHIGDTLTTISELKRSGLTSDELVAILDANDAVMDAVEPQFAAIFANRLSKTTASQLEPLIEIVRATTTPLALPTIVPLGKIMSDSLEHALNLAAETNSTKPVTAWRNSWMKKDGTGQFVFAAREHQTKLRDVCSVYYNYLLRMQAAELYDFDDMIMRVVHAMEIFPELRFNLQEKFQYIMVDEFQDTNLAQMRILYNLTNNEVSGGEPNILAVGDDDQAIYSFQGADISNIINFRDLYTGVKIITLTDNYRSTEQILTAAREVITQGSERLESIIEGVNKQLVAHSTAATTVELRTADTIGDERHQLVQSIAARLENGEAPESIAVLARRHHELISLLPYFSSAGIAVNYERRDNVLDIAPIMLLELIAKVVVALFEKQHAQVEALLPALLAHPVWKFEPKAIWKLSLTAYNSHTSWMEVMATTPEFMPFQEWLIELAAQVPHTPLEQLLDTIFGRFDQQVSDDETSEVLDPFEDEPLPKFISPLRDFYFPHDKLQSAPDEYLVYLEALRTIRNKLREYQPGETPTLQTFLTFINLHRQLGSSITSIRPHVSTQTGAVNLMTAHKSKGLEFPTVYLPGAIDTAWGERVRSRNRLINYPENLPLAPVGGNLDERLRLFFVAMTRAKRNLIISYSLANENGKATLGASFLLDTSLEPQTMTTQHTAADLIEAAEQRWYEPLVSLSHATMESLLQPMLENYKLSATHLNNFLDVSRGGPEAFLLNNLLRFPQAMGPAAAYGSAMHEALQHTHAHLIATGNRRPIEDILHDFEQSLHGQHLSDSDFGYYLQKGSDALNIFLASQYDSFSVSQKTELNFANQHVEINGARLSGSLDLVDIDADEKTILVTDYKTGKASQNWVGKTDYEKIKLHKYRQQLMFYTLLIQNARDYHSYEVIGGRLQFVEPTKSGEIVCLEEVAGAQELERFKRLIVAVWQKITTLDLPDTSAYSQDYKGMLAFEADLLGEATD